MTIKQEYKTRLAELLHDISVDCVQQNLALPPAAATAARKAAWENYCRLKALRDALSDALQETSS